MQAVLLNLYNFIILGYEKILIHTGIMINSLMSTWRLIIQQARHDTYRLSNLSLYPRSGHYCLPPNNCF